MTRPAGGEEGGAAPVGFRLQKKEPTRPPSPLTFLFFGLINFWAEDGAPLTLFLLLGGIFVFYWMTGGPMQPPLQTVQNCCHLIPDKWVSPIKFRVNLRSVDF